MTTVLCECGRREDRRAVQCRACFAAEPTVRVCTEWWEADMCEVGRRIDAELAAVASAALEMDPEQLDESRRGLRVRKYSHLHRCKPCAKREDAKPYALTMTR